MSVLVFGSLNMDLVTRVPRLPAPGETLMGTTFFTTAGGKGANQAVAAAKLGATTHMIGRVGNDAWGESLIQGLRAVGVETAGIAIEPDLHTGVAVITVAESGENQIIGVYGANDRLDATDIQRLQTQLPQAKVLLLQLEVSVDAVRQAAQVAKQAGVVVILDPAPVREESIVDLYPNIDFLIPNEVEASQLVGFTVHNPETAAKAAKVFHQQGIPSAIIKLGAQGALYSTPIVSGEPSTKWFPAFSVEAIDAVAAGDAFAGGLAVALSEGRSIEEAIRWGCAAGAIATTRVGAQVAMGDRTELEALLANS